MRVQVQAAILIAFGLGVYGCGGSAYGSGANPSSPTPPSTTTAAANIVTINVVAVNGAQSFSPNPASIPAGQMVVWHNVDTITHHVVFNDGSVDTGNLAPGASSQPMTISAGQYHCSIHPVMVGSANQATTAPPDCTGAYCG
jgi:plastocyanin